MKCLCKCGENAPGNRKFKHGHIERYIKNHPGTLCACGCSTLVYPTESNLFPRFVKGHSRRGAKLSQETKDQIRGSVNEWWGHNTFTAEQLQVISNAVKGKRPHDYSPEMRAKVKTSLSEYWNTHTHSPESIEKIRQANLGAKRSEETKSKISKALIRAIAEGRATVPSRKDFKIGFREDLGHSVRSSWEANFARLLKFLGREYEFESRRFVLHDEDGKVVGSYLPDFLVGDHFVEVWGFPGEIDKGERIKHFQREYPEFPLVIIYEEQYKKLEVKFSKYIPEWEF